MRSAPIALGVALLVAVLAGTVLLSGDERRDEPWVPSELADEPRRQAGAQAAVEQFATAYGRFVAGRATLEDLREAGASRRLADQLRRSGERVPPGLASARFVARNPQVYADPADRARMVGNIQLVDQDGTALPISVVLAHRQGRWLVVDFLAGGDEL